MPEIIDLADIDDGVLELAARAGVPAAAMWAAVRELAPGGAGDEMSLAQGVAAVARALEAEGVDLSGPAPDPGQELGLSGRVLTAEGRQYVQDENDEWVPAGDDPDSGLASQVQRELAASGHRPDTRIALSDTDPWTAGMDAADAALVAVHRRAAAAGGSYRKHFESMLHLNPALAGVLGLAAGDASDSGMSGGDEASRIIARQAHTGMFGNTGGRDGAAHTSACDSDCATDHRQNRKPVSGMSGHRDVDAIVNRHQGTGLFGREDPISGNQSGASWTREADRH